MKQAVTINLDHGYFSNKYGYHAEQQDPRYIKYFVTWNAGLFSCLTTTIWGLLSLNKSNLIVNQIDNHHGMFRYKNSKNENNWNSLFEPANTDELLLNSYINSFDNFSWEQFDKHMSNYENINFPLVEKIIDIYFRPSWQVRQRIEYFNDKYKLDEQDYLAIYIRGLDKKLELARVDLTTIVEKANLIVNQQNLSRIWIQTDDKAVLDHFVNAFKMEKIVINELETSSGDVGIHTAPGYKPSTHTAIDLIALVWCLSRSNQIFVNTSNVSFWISILRGHAEQLYHFHSREQKVFQYRRFRAKI